MIICKQNNLTRIIRNNYRSKRSLDILNQLIKIKIDVSHPEFRIGLATRVYVRPGNYLVKLFLIILFLYQLPFPILNWLFILLLLQSLQNWFLCVLSRLRLEYRLRTVAQELCVCAQNILFLEHYVPSWILLHLVPCQTFARLKCVICHQCSHHLLEFRDFN